MLVRVTDIDISFGQMVILLVKLAIASIPAAILLMVIVVLVMMLFGGLLGGVAGLGSLMR